MDPSNVPVESLVPHRGAMLLIDKVLFDDGETTRVAATVREGLFVRDGQLPAWVGIELMAQGIAAWAGLRRLEAKETVRLGFLLGTRRYECSVAGFEVGARLEVESHLELVSAQGLAVFGCRLFQGAALLASANLNVFQPADVQQYLKEKELTDG
jgi:predicted hotdog family 3-hydroxylacyl-ACP dehydratase